MEKIIFDFLKQFRVGFEAAKHIKFKEKFSGVCVCAMGGSALPGSLYLMWANKNASKIPVILHRDYGLPSRAEKNWLIVGISYSGNTEEAVSSIKEAIENGFKSVIITSGGELEKIAKSYKIPFALVPGKIPPRMALFYQFSALIQVLLNNGLAEFDKKEILEMEKNTNPEYLRKEGLSLSKKLSGKIPLIYCSNRLKTISRIWKIAFNENCKIPAFWNYFPEMNHNEMVGFTKNKKPAIGNQKLFHFIMIKDDQDHQRIQKRMDLTAKILRSQGVKGEILSLSGKNFSEKIFSSIILANWTSYFLSLSYKIDPLPVELVEDLKKRLQQP